MFFFLVFEKVVFSKDTYHTKQDGKKGGQVRVERGQEMEENVERVKRWLSSVWVYPLTYLFEVMKTLILHVVPTLLLTPSSHSRKERMVRGRTLSACLIGGCHGARSMT